MIDIDKLPTGSFVGWSNNATGFFGPKIQFFSEKEAKQYNIPSKDIAVHIFMIIKNDKEAIVIESHANTNGVHKEIYSEWVKNYNPEKHNARRYRS